MRKIVLIFFITLFTLIALTFFLINIDKISQININKVNKYEIDPKMHEYYINDEVGRDKLILEVAKKNNDWSNLPLSENFRKKYNEKDGIFGKLKFDSIDLNYYKEGEKSYIGGTHHLRLKDGKQEIIYLIYGKHTEKKDFTEIPLLDDVDLFGPIYLTDKNGKEVDYRLPFTDDLKESNLNKLARGDVYTFYSESSVAVSERFHKKYPFFLDLFIHYSPLSFNRITFLEKESDLDNNIAIFEVDSVLECKKRKYKVKLILDKRLYLDEAEVELIKEAEYEGDWTYITAKLLYKNSNWDSLELTDNFRKKYTPAKGIIKEIDEMNIDYGLGTETVVANKEYIKTFMHKDMYEVKYKLEYIYNEDDYVDDIVVTKID